MAIYKRKGSPHWWIRFTAPNGERIRKSSGTKDKQAAAQLDIKWQSELWNQQNLDTKPPRLWIEAVLKWLDEKEVYKKSIRTDKVHLKWLSTHLGALTLDQIDKTVINQIVDEKKKAGKNGKMPSNATINRILQLIRSILRCAQIDWDWIDAIPQFKLLPEPKNRIRWLSKEEVATLIKELPEHQKNVVLFALSTGLRQANVLGLKWDSVDLDRRHAFVRPDESKSKKAIPVPLNDLAMAVLQERQRAEDKNPQWVFTYKGGRIKQANTKAWKNALKRAGIKNFRWHDLRHTWSSWHVQSGTSLQVLQELGGWASYSMVLRYAHLSAEHLRENAGNIIDAKLAQLIKSDA